MDQMWRNKHRLTEDALKKEIKALKQDLSSIKESDNNNQSSLVQLQQYMKQLSAENQQIKNLLKLQKNNNQNTAEHKELITKNIELTDEEKRKNKEKLNISKVIFGGTIAKGVLISGAEAGTGVSNVADPTPLIIKLIGEAVAPNGKKINLSHCTITASGYGDLSSERLLARLEKMTCINNKHQGSITKVVGYIAGNDNKHGIRGEVVSKDIKFLQNSVVGGIFSSIGRTLAPGSETLNPLKGGAILKPEATSTKLANEFSAGGANSFDKLSDYYLKQADKLHPVVVVNGGQKVDVVFSEASFLGNYDHHLNEYYN
jgi:hypothetical protein